MSTSRRGFLGGCLAAGLALSGCSGEEPSPAASASADPTRLTFADAAPAPSLDPVAYTPLPLPTIHTV
ncbi:hypothetical protein SA13R_09940 [Rothia kristinae]|uniref:twin-arginine translocation signal domain-containing protein n=1 Tax=Rothia kristinae TaxID=37923 RepID=UPI0007369077|nr:twin-arginine translocation signal domain-containing protein [Rothia kristinae]KTR86309.1 hypothetical protein SA13R_09940 [Rothia kristinae]